MKLVPYYRPLSRSYSTMNDMIDNFFKRGFDDSFFDSFKVDVEKEKDRYVVTADLPGIKKENIHLDVEDDLLTIAVQQEENKEESDEGKHYLHRERRVVNTSRQVRLNDVDQEKIEAKLEDGVLTVVLPLQEEVSNKKAIEIQ